MYKLEKQIIEMENFASHLEEVFMAVEVRARLMGHTPPPLGTWQQPCLRRVGEPVSLLRPPPRPPPPQPRGHTPREPLPCGLCLLDCKLSWGGGSSVCRSSALLQPGLFPGPPSLGPHPVAERRSFTPLLPLCPKCAQRVWRTAP